MREMLSFQLGVIGALILSVASSVSIVICNKALMSNLGYPLITKLAIIPVTVLLETVFLKKQFSPKIKLSLFLLLVGVGIASITDLQLNFVGTILSLLAIVTTCVGQIASF